ncbi:MAG: thiamine pyrophosphate-dependent dehydrogenase E1 component subunit alpha [Candidatus Tectomicrobia bacterium]|nr:thiamine pyrophosphate-dependent dehydrogenase E1 component subunit alpha [Candidatus Tectomicrobia bacterium]
MLPDVSAERLVAIGRRMLLIRRFEERLITLFQDKVFVGHYHVYIGQEATGVPAIAQLRPDDFLFSTHRNHGHNLARGVDPKMLLAEILGRVGGMSRGKAGTLHLSDPQRGIFHTSAVVGGSMPLATGAALAGKQLGKQQVSVCLFGDGALEEGAAYEAMNLASLWKVPIIFICENNCLEAREDIPGAWHTTCLTTQRLIDIAAALGHSTAAIDGGDVGAMWSAMSQALDRVRGGEGPCFIEAATIRWPGNFGLWPELPMGLTNLAWVWGAGEGPAAYEGWFREQDPLLRYLRELQAAGIADRDTILAWDEAVRKEVDAAAQFALGSPSPEPAEARRHVFVEAGR